MAVSISEVRPVVSQPMPQKVDPSAKSSEGAETEESGFTFGEILSSAPAGFALANDLLNANSTIQIKETGPRETNFKKTTEVRDIKEAENKGPTRIVAKKEKADDLTQQIRVDDLTFKEAEILETTKTDVVSMRPEESILIEGPKQDEGFSFEALGRYNHLKNEADTEGTNSAVHAMIQQASSREVTTTTDKAKFSGHAEKTVEAVSTAHLSSDSSMTANSLALEEEIAIDPRIAQAVNRVLSQPVTTAQVQILAQPVALVPPLASAVPLQFEKGSDAQSHLMAATVIEGAEKPQSGGQESSLSQEHSGSFTNQRPSETTGAQLAKTTESLSQTSTNQAEKVQALQQVIQDFKQQLSKISNRPTNLKISVKHEKFGNVDVKLNFNEKDKTVSAIFQADSAEMIQMLTQQRSEIEDIFNQDKSSPTAVSLQFHKTKEI